MDKISKIKKLTLLFIFITLPLGYFARVSIGNIFVGLYYWDIFLSFYLGLLVWIYLKDRKYKIDLPVFYKITLVFIVYAALVTLNSYRYLNSIPDFIVSSLYLVRWSIYAFSGMALYLDLRAGAIDGKFIKNLIIGEGVLISIIGFLQLIFLPDFTVLDQSLLWDPHQNRLAGLYFDPNFAGIILVLTLCVVLSEILNITESKKTKSKKVLNLLFFYIFAFLTMLSAIILTFSRSTWLALAVVVFVMGLIKYKWIIPIAVLGMFLVYYAVPRIQTRISGVTDPSDSFYYRLVSWRETYEIAKLNPLIGYGFNSYRFVRQNLGFIKYDEGLGDRSDSGSDSSILFIWVTTGLIGLTIFLIAHLKLFFQTLKVAKVDNLALVLTGLEIGLLVNSQFINSLFFPALVVNLVLLNAVFLASHSFDSK